MTILSETWSVLKWKMTFHGFTSFQHWSWRGSCGSTLALSAYLETKREQWMLSPKYSDPPHIGFCKPEGMSKGSSLGILSIFWSLGNSGWSSSDPSPSWQVYHFQLLFICAREKFVSSGQTFNWAWPAAELCNFPWCRGQHIITSGIQLDNALSTKS